jgi:putative Mg2+ transporter-C (MgtC) family protein
MNVIAASWQTLFSPEFWQQFSVTLIPLLLAALLGGTVGFERESTGRPAGLRTHILVCVGSALTMLVSMEMYRMTLGIVNADPGRIAAQVISGIGFLGAGTIMREGANIRGLTTAASLWVVAAVGLAVGAQLYMPAVLSVIIILVTLRTLSELEKRFIKHVGFYDLNVHVLDTPGRLGAVASVVGRAGGNIRAVSLTPSDTVGTVNIKLKVKVPAGKALHHIVQELCSAEGVLQVTEEE